MEELQASKTRAKAPLRQAIFANFSCRFDDSAVSLRLSVPIETGRPLRHGVE
jgi:hypothetical protein